MQAYANQMRTSSKSIAFVPTMGYLHEGHQSLLKAGRSRGDSLVLSIFVNPTQFGPNEDLDSYPSNLSKDLEIAEKEGVDVVFTPEKQMLYGDNYQTYVKLDELPKHLCGLSRPVHFKGVATVVTKLFNIVKPDVAIFGQKDFQQLAVIRQMTADLNFDIEIVGAPTVREHDGLAMSSRNSYLTNDQRSSGLALSKSLQQATEMVRNGETRAEKVIQAATTLISSYPDTGIDYISICDPDTLDNVTVIDRPVLMALAVMVGKTRLIDNMILNT